MELHSPGAAESPVKSANYTPLYYVSIDGITNDLDPVPCNGIANDHVEWTNCSSVVLQERSARMLGCMHGTGAKCGLYHGIAKSSGDEQAPEQRQSMEYVTVKWESNTCEMISWVPAESWKDARFGAKSLSVTPGSIYLLNISAFFLKLATPKLARGVPDSTQLSAKPPPTHRRHQGEAADKLEWRTMEQVDGEQGVLVRPLETKLPTHPSSRPTLTRRSEVAAPRSDAPRMEGPTTLPLQNGQTRCEISTRIPAESWKDARLREKSLYVTPENIYLSKISAPVITLATPELARGVPDSSQLADDADHREHHGGAAEQMERMDRTTGAANSKVEGALGVLVRPLKNKLPPQNGSLAKQQIYFKNGKQPPTEEGGAASTDAEAPTMAGNKWRRRGKSASFTPRLGPKGLKEEANVPGTADTPAHLAGNRQRDKAENWTLRGGAPATKTTKIGGAAIAFSEMADKLEVRDDTGITCTLVVDVPNPHLMLCPFCLESKSKRGVGAEALKRMKRHVAEAHKRHVTFRYKCGVCSEEEPDDKKVGARWLASHLDKVHGVQVSTAAEQHSSTRGDCAKALNNAAPSLSLSKKSAPSPPKRTTETSVASFFKPTDKASKGKRAHEQISKEDDDCPKISSTSRTSPTNSPPVKKTFAAIAATPSPPRASTPTSTKWSREAIVLSDSPSSEPSRRRVNIWCLIHDTGVDAWIDSDVMTLYCVHVTKKNPKFGFIDPLNYGNDTTETVRKLTSSTEKEAFLFPICQNNHWTLLVIGRTVARYYDPLRYDVPEGVRKLLEDLQKPLVNFEFETPRQHDSWNCGVHVMQMAKAVTTNTAISQADSEKDLRKFRKRLQLGLETKFEVFAEKHRPLAKKHHLLSKSARSPTTEDSVDSSKCRHCRAVKEPQCTPQYTPDPRQPAPRSAQRRGSAASTSTAASDARVGSTQKERPVESSSATPTLRMDDPTPQTGTRVGDKIAERVPGVLGTDESTASAEEMDWQVVKAKKRRHQDNETRSPAHKRPVPVRKEESQVVVEKPPCLMAMKIQPPERKKLVTQKEKKRSNQARPAPMKHKKTPGTTGAPALLIADVRKWCRSHLDLYTAEGRVFGRLEWIAEVLTSAIQKARDGSAKAVELLLARHPPPLPEHGASSTQTARIQPPKGSASRANAKPETAERLRSIYYENRSKAVDMILGKESPRCRIDIEKVEKHFKETTKAAAVSEKALETVCSGLPELMVNGTIEADFEAPEVKKLLSKIKDTAPGADGLKYSHLYWFDPEGELLARIFDECRRHRRIPAHWKEAETILLPKDCTEEERKRPENWRPIALMPTIYKAYTSLWTQRINAVPGVISPCQRGFQSMDGCHDSIAVLRLCIDVATSLNRNLAVSWLDLTNAFGSVPHRLITKSLQKLGFPEGVVEVVRDLYHGATTRVRTETETTAPIKILAGVKQGDPISPTLFNICLEGILRRHLETSDGHNCVGSKIKCLAFADDLAILADTKEQLQERIKKLDDDCRSVGLIFKPKKCASLILNQGRVDMSGKISIQADKLRSLAAKDTYKYLGVATGSTGRTSELEKLIETTKDIEKVVGSDLAPFQKLDAIKTFILPRLTHLYRNATPKLSELREFENVVMKACKAAHNIPIRGSPTEYIMSSIKDGGLGVMSPRYTSVITYLSAMLQRLWHGERSIREMYQKALARIAAKHLELRKAASTKEQCQFLNSANTKKTGYNLFFRMTEAIRTLAVNKESPLGKMEFVEKDGTVALKIHVTETSKEIVFTRDDSKNMQRRLIDTVRGALLKKFLQEKDVKSRVVQVIQQHPPSNRFVKDGRNISIAAQKFVHRARLNLLACNANTFDKSAPKSCRRCGAAFESQIHILQNCKYQLAAGITERHDRILQMVMEEVGKGAKKDHKMAVDQELGSSRLRPDIVLSTDKEVLMADVTIPYENGMAAMENAWQQKLKKYQKLVSHLKSAGKTAKILPIVVGSLGTYWSKTSESLAELGLSPVQIRTLIPDLCRCTMESSKNIYWKHILGDRYKMVDRLCWRSQKEKAKEEGYSKRAEKTRKSQGATWNPEPQSDRPDADGDVEERRGRKKKVGGRRGPSARKAEAESRRRGSRSRSRSTREPKRRSRSRTGRRPQKKSQKEVCSGERGWVSEGEVGGRRLADRSRSRGRGWLSEAEASPRLVRFADDDEYNAWRSWRDRMRREEERMGELDRRRREERRSEDWMRRDVGWDDRRMWRDGNDRADEMEWRMRRDGDRRDVDRRSDERIEMRRDGESSGRRSAWGW